MIEINQEIKTILKNPLGPIVTEEELQKTKKKIISIGDICTLSLIKKGIRIEMAVFDFRTKRKEITQEEKEILKKLGEFIKIENPPGKLNEQIILDARKLIDQKKNIMIIGEEDLTALAFILELKDDEIVVYGQPEVGIVKVENNPKLKQMIKRWLKIE